MQMNSHVSMGQRGEALFFSLHIDDFFLVVYALRFLGPGFKLNWRFYHTSLSFLYSLYILPF